MFLTVLPDRSKQIFKITGVFMWLGGLQSQYREGKSVLPSSQRLNKATPGRNMNRNLSIIIIHRGKKLASI